MLIRSITETVLQEVRIALSGARHGHVVFVTGDAGIGKSTVLRQVREALLHDVHAPIMATAECSAPIAGGTVGEIESLKPLVEIMAQIIAERARRASSAAEQDRWLRVLFTDIAPSWAHLLPDGQVYTAPLAATSDQRQIVHQYVAFLRIIGSEQPLVIMLDDAHWADDSTVNVLDAAGSHLLDVPVVFLVAYREADAAASHAGAGHAINRFMSDARSVHAATVVTVPPVTLDEQRRVLQDRFPEYHGMAHTEEVLLERTGGNLLFLGQVLDTLVAEGRLDARTGQVHGDLESLQVPRSATTIVEERLHQLSDEEHVLLRAASVEGLTFTARTLARLVDQSVLKVVQRLRAIEQHTTIIKDAGKQTLVREPSQSWQFTHSLVQRYLYEQLPPAERDAYHDRIIAMLEGELLEARSARVNIHVVAVRLSIHQGLRGRFEQAARVLLEGATFLWDCWSADEALRLIGLCLYAIRRVRRDHSGALPELEAQALLLRARIQNHQGHHTQSLHTFESALAVAQHIGDDRLITDALLGIGSSLWVMGEFDRVLSLANRALEMSRSSGNTMGEVRSRNLIGNVHYRVSEFDLARQSYDEALRCARDNGHLVDEARVLGNLGTVAFRLRDHTRALALLHESYELYDRLSLVTDAARIHQNIGAIKIRMGDLLGAIATLQEGLRAARNYGARLEESRILMELASAHERLDQYDEALRLSEQAIDLKRQLKDTTGLVNAMGVYAMTLAHLVRWEEALEIYDQAMELAERHHMSYELQQLSIGRANTLESMERFDDALEQFKAALRMTTEGLELKTFVTLHLDVVHMLSKSTKLSAQEVEAELAPLRTALHELMASSTLDSEFWSTIKADWRAYTNTELMSH